MAKQQRQKRTEGKGAKEKKGEKKGNKAKVQEKGPKRPPFKLLLFILVPLLFVGGGGFVVWKFVLKKPPAEGQVVKKKEKKERKKKKEKVPLSYMSLKPFVVNLQGSGRRFLRISITLALEGEKGAEIAQKEIPPIRNAILLLLTNKRFEEVTTVEGKKQLQKEIQQRVNRLLEGTKVREVYFTEFIAQ